MKNFQHFSLKIVKKIEDFRKFSIFRFFIKDFNPKFRKHFHLKKYFSEKIGKKFQVDITSSDLNEIWIGQKILKAESLLLNISTIFMGLGGDKWSPERK